MIKAVVFVTLLGIATVVNGQMCNKVVCGTPETGKCASYKTDGKTWTVKACTSAQKCNIAGFQGATTAAECNAYTKPTVTETERSPGFSCTTTAGCYSGICTGNICQGIEKGATTACINWTASPTAADKAKLCGANAYCNTDSKCVGGSTTTCSDTVPCAYPKRCNGTTCIDVGSVLVDKTCADNLDCADGNFCDGTTCKASVSFTKGKFLAPCAAATDCAGGATTCSCALAPTNTEGKGACSGVATGYYSTAYLNAERAYWKGITASKCPLLVKDVDGACFATFTAPSGGTFTFGDCYATFRFGTTDATADFLPPKPKPDDDKDSGSSSTKIVASVVGFLAYFLF